LIETANDNVMRFRWWIRTWPFCLCSLKSGWRHFIRTCCLYRQKYKFTHYFKTFALKMKERRCSEMKPPTTIHDNLRVKDNSMTLKIRGRVKTIPVFIHIEWRNWASCLKMRAVVCAASWNRLSKSVRRSHHGQEVCQRMLVAISY